MQKLETRGERERSRGVPTTTIIYVDGDMSPRPQERRTRQSNASGKLVKGYYCKPGEKREQHEWNKKEIRVLRSKHGASDSVGRSELPENENVKRALKPI